MARSTSSASASCGTARGLTKDVASITLRPVVDSSSISLTFACVGTSACSVCSASRGPTSTTVTASGMLIGHLQQHLACTDDVACRDVDGAHDAAGRRLHRQLYLHRLEQHQHLPLRHLVAF